jgi:DNA repair photolyase
MIQKASGNMYEWVDYVHSYLRGACPYACPYCYVQAIAKRFNNQAMMGPLRFDDAQLNEDYNAEKLKGKKIFIEHTHDLFHPEVDGLQISEVFGKCMYSKHGNYVFQTRNTRRASNFAHLFDGCRTIIGTTIETDRRVGNAPHPLDRAINLKNCKIGGVRTFVTIEPILEFDRIAMLELLERAEPDFVNIGADSKGTGLEEPSKEKVLALIDGIKGLGIEIRTKRNLERLIGK